MSYSGITPLPPAPQRDDIDNFADMADVFVAALDGFQKELNDAGYYVKAQAAFISGVSGMALASSNFKGTWSAGTTYNVPSSVYYNNKYWIAMTSSTGVTPTESAIWKEITLGYSGVSGASGRSGVIGFSGGSGFSGFSGRPGPTGPAGPGTAINASSLGTVTSFVLLDWDSSNPTVIGTYPKWDSNIWYNKALNTLSVPSAHIRTSGAVGSSVSPSTDGVLVVQGEVRVGISDERLKDFYGTIPDALAKVLTLNGYLYKENEVAKSLGCCNDRLQVGLSAQELEKVLPEAITEAPVSAEYKTIYYDRVVPLLVEAIKELYAEIKQLKGE
jgi:hypothetical protein